MGRSLAFQMGFLRCGEQSRFAADDRSHTNAVGAVIGRETGNACSLTHRGVLFAATDRSHIGRS